LGEPSLAGKLLHWESDRCWQSKFVRASLVFVGASLLAIKDHRLQASSYIGRAIAAGNQSLYRPAWFFVGASLLAIKDHRLQASSYIGKQSLLAIKVCTGQPGFL